MPHSHAVILLILIILSAISGVLFGWFFGDLSLQIGWLGDLFLNALKMVIIPLIVASVISGIGALGDIRKLGRLGGSTLLYYALTTATAVFIGLVVVNIIQPGAGIELGDATVPERILEKQGTGASDIVMSLISPNLFASATEMQLLPLIVFAIMFAMALTTIGERSKPVFAVFDGINEAMMKLVIWIMYFAPIGIFALIAARLGMAGGGDALFREIQAVGWHVVTVLTGLFIHFCFLLLLLQMIAGKGFNYLMGMSRALVTGFGTASSTATLPLTMENARENKVSDKAIKFVLPLGSTVNMDGTALYEAAAVLFIAQAYGIDLTMTQQIIVFITATL
ncbi:dicarboxylate/amino acid:cation symporter, partial [uncultured Methylophaga sp.]